MGRKRFSNESTAALRESEERFRRVFEEGPLGFAFVGKDYRILKVNNALCQLLGYSEAELLQLSFPEITHPDDVQADLESAERLFRREIPFYRMRKRYVKKNGEIMWANLNATIFRDQESEPMYGLGMVEDITEVKRIQEEAVARQKRESLGVLVEGIAHDFNNLLGGILAEAELAEADLAANLSPGEAIARIKAVADRGAEIVRELMIYAGQDRVSLVEPLDLSRLLEEMLELLKVSVSKQIDLKIELDKKLPAVLGSAAQIRQVVMNLVINASDAIGSKEGIIYITTSLVTREYGSGVTGAADFPAGDYVRLGVSDTGCGMTEEVSAKIFDPFFTTKFAGRGLGLAVVQGIVRAHGGAVSLVSAPGRGATFQVLLPCTSMRALEVVIANPSSQATQSNAGTGTVLVVEDEEVLRVAVSKALRNRGYSVLDAGDGSAAMDLFLAHKDKIDAVLLDFTLPGKSSREVFEEIQCARPDVKIILTSAYSQETVAASGLRTTHFIRKPFKLAELAGVLRNVLSA
jgi:two-component system cell cycle sensor histidine kinase/response regulator CckA